LHRYRYSPILTVERRTCVITEKTKRLYRSDDERIIAGVCGGIGEYFDIDPTIIRLLWVVFILAGGSGIIAYILAWIIVPERPLIE
jgi:phage shock protein C